MTDLWTNTLLELIRLKRLRVRQDEAFGEINVTKVA